MRQEEALTAELSVAFEALRGRCGAPDALDYFIGLAKNYFGLTAAKPQNEALILGSGFPEELLWANRIVPHWVIGGSLSLSGIIDSRVPRDADAVSRSMFGYLENYFPGAGERIPVIVPISGDNQRKLAYLLQDEDRNVMSIDIAPEMPPAKLHDALANQLSTILGELTFSWHLPGAGRRLGQAMRQTAQARAAARTVLTDPTLPISGMLKMFLLNTYFYAGDLSEWSQQLLRFAKAAKAHPPETGAEVRKPGVLIVGSPVLFPNYKVPLLLEACGLNILGTCDYLSGKVLSPEVPPQRTGRRALLYSLVRQVYDNDCSGAFVQNRALYAQASHMLDSLDIQGVVFHIIKGQIEYDFELERLEQLFSAHRVPVFRLETDYHDNDMEQLHIRLEAFSELLTQDLSA